jgi:hypothetical protein
MVENATTSQKRSAKSRLIHACHETIYRFWVQPWQRLTKALQVTHPGAARRAALALTKWLANLGRFAIADLRLQVHLLSGASWSAAYIGPGFSFEELCYTLFPAAPSTKLVRKIFPWQLPSIIRRLEAEVDLIAIELNPIVRWRPRGALPIRAPRWINQVLYIARPMEEIMAGMNQNMRRNLRKIDKHGFRYRFSQAPEDYDLFYHKMYRPYIQQRHGARATLSAYDALRGQFQHGGLIVIEHNGAPVCAMLCETADGVCYAGPMGVHEDHFEQVPSGSNVALWWYMMDWARQQNLRYFDFGSSRPQTSNGVFQFKRQWGTQVTSQKDTESYWMLHSVNMPRALREHLNQRGFISEHKGSHYQVLLLAPGEQLSRTELEHKQAQASENGLAGVLTVAASEHTKVRRYQPGTVYGG